MITWRVADVEAHVEIGWKHGDSIIVDWLGRVFHFELDLLGILCLSFSVRWPRFRRRRREARGSLGDELWFRSEDHGTQQLILDVADESGWLVVHRRMEPTVGAAIPGLGEPPPDWRLN